jgi:hypothetical protein
MYLYRSVRRNAFISAAKPDCSGFFRASICRASYTFSVSDVMVFPLLHGERLKEEVAPDAVLNIEPAAGDGQVNVRMQVELAVIGMQGAEDADVS